MEFLELIDQIADPRESYKVRHNLSTLLFCTLSAVVCGAESWSDIEDFCEAKLEWLRNMLILAIAYHQNSLFIAFLL